MRNQSDRAGTGVEFHTRSAQRLRSSRPGGFPIRRAIESRTRHEWQESLTFVALPAAALASSNRAARVDATLPHAAVRPWAPAHVRAARVASADVAISWVRCARIGGDAWAPGEPPLGAPAESYVLEVLDGEVVVRSVNTDVPSFLYSAADQTADFGAPPASLHIRVAQIGESGASGLNSELTITL
jgi:hypothetical protein